MITSKEKPTLFVQIIALFAVALLLIATVAVIVGAATLFWWAVVHLIIYAFNLPYAFSLWQALALGVATGLLRYWIKVDSKKGSVNEEKG